jgi:hypothetical protein
MKTDLHTNEVPTLNTYDPNKTEAILKAIEKVILGNNGYAWIGDDVDVANAVANTGMIVRRRFNDFNDRFEWIGYTATGWKAALETSRYLESM